LLLVSNFQCRHVGVDSAWAPVRPIVDACTVGGRVLAMTHDCGCDHRDWYCLSTACERGVCTRYRVCFNCTRAGSMYVVMLVLQADVGVPQVMREVELSVAACTCIETVQLEAVIRAVTGPQCMLPRKVTGCLVTEALPQAHCTSVFTAWQESSPLGRLLHKY
jgi:hypothetical protein